MSSASVEGLGFAIPITNAKIIIDDLISYGYVTGKPQIGISGVDIDEINSRYYNIPQGIWVSTVKKGGAAEKAGIKQSDVIIGIEGEPVLSIAEMNKIKNKYKAGDKITLTVNRAGEDMEFELVLQEIKENT
jgi:serine protease Do